MKRFAFLASVVLVSLLTAAQAAANPAPGDGSPATCDGLAAGAACDYRGAIGECVAPDAVDGSAGDAGLVCTSIPVTTSCGGKPAGAACLLDGAGDVGFCSGDGTDRGVSCEAYDDEDTAPGSGGCAVGTPDASSAFAFLGLLLPLAMRRRRRR